MKRKQKTSNGWKTIKLTLFTASSLLCLALPISLAAQYQETTMLNFENTDGESLPKSILHGHNSTPFTTSLVAWENVDQELLFGENGVPAELGNHGLKFEPLEQEPHLSVMNDFYLNRQLLKNGAAALFETDFFMPAGSDTHTMAIMASHYDPNYGQPGSGYRFYRFGIQGDRVYFSFTDSEPQPLIYERQSLSDFNLQRPGWHRLQMAIHSDGNIYCYLDGIQTSFSPIQETTLVNIAPGIMVTKYKQSEGPIYTDNMGVFWSPDSTVSIPASPWSDGAPTAKSAASIDWDRSNIVWTTRMSEAWKESRRTGHHILVFAHDSDYDATMTGLQYLESNQAKPLMNFVVPFRLNLAQKDNESIASKLGITETPAFMTLDSEGVPFSKPLAVTEGMQWQSIQKHLTNK